jgi:hypothetical protein
MRLGSASCGAEAHEPTQCALFPDFPDASPQAWAAMAASNNKTLAAITKCLRESALRTLDESVPSKTFAPHGAGGALKLRWRPRRCQSYNKFTVNVTAEPKSRFQLSLRRGTTMFYPMPHNHSVSRTLWCSPPSVLRTCHPDPREAGDLLSSLSHLSPVFQFRFRRHQSYNLRFRLRRCPAGSLHSILIPPAASRGKGANSKTSPRRD